MDFGIGTYGLGYLAGLLSTLSPCVLPLIPILLATALGAHRLGPYALAAGVALSFALVGTALVTLSTSLGIAPEQFRVVAAWVLIALSIVLLSPALQARFASATSGASTFGDSILQRFQLDGVCGQFAIGLLLGVIWSPCVGPTLGAATTLASQGKDLPQVALLMAIFGIGASTPLVLLSHISGSALKRVRNKMMNAGRYGKYVLGAAMLLLGIAILTRWDKALETYALERMPEWLVTLMTRY